MKIIWREEDNLCGLHPNLTFVLVPEHLFFFLHIFFEPAIFCMNAAPNAMLHNNSLSDEKNTITINTVQ
jgi:hypothetical protein